MQETVKVCKRTKVVDLWYWLSRINEPSFVGTTGSKHFW